MELLSVGVTGYRRFEKDTGMLDVAGNPIAVVGPNEVGKTSFLRALEHLNEPGPFAPNELTRGGSAEAEIHAVFALDENERAAVARLRGIGDPRIFKVWNRGGTTMVAAVEPSLKRSRAIRERTINGLGRLLATKWFKALDQGDELAERLAELYDTLPDEGETLEQERLGQLRETAGWLGDHDNAPPSALRLATTLTELAEHESLEHPNDAARNYLFKQRPVFLWFAADRRQIESSYSIDDEPSPALENLFALINFDLNELRGAIDRNDRPRVAELTNEARDAFSELFRGRWRQAHVRVELDVEGREVHVFVTNTRGRLIPIAERSEGLRQFIALLAFVEHEAAGQDAIVLVDEAEQHLHYDAQADLVRVFSGQTTAKKIIYTTHSAGCLPHDLGSGVRVLEPAGPETVPAEEWDRSRVRNWFWTESPGFLPLLMAMGASSFAFAGARKAVVAEGISDVLLLPTLLREATKRAVIEFQIAPGLANVNESTLSELDFVASRVGYLVDGDEAGRAKRQELVDAGIASERIFVLGGRGRLSLEDVLQKEFYLKAVNHELGLRHGVQIPFGEVPNIGRKKAVETWCDGQHDAKGNTVAHPSERAVAHHLFQMQRDARLRGETIQILDPTRQEMLVKLHDAIVELLGRPSYSATSENDSAL